MAESAPFSCGRKTFPTSSSTGSRGGRGSLSGTICGCLINGRVDLALASGADGVHLPAQGLPAAPLRQRFGARVLLGRSTHRIAEVEAAAADGLDYVTFGPVFPTPSKARYGPPVGLERLERACGVGIPVYALGGG